MGSSPMGGLPIGSSVVALCPSPPLPLYFVPMPPASLRALLQGVIDYAGLFPPAGLDLRTAVAEYATHRAGTDGWMLGRFVVQAARLEEFGRTAEPCLPDGGEGWRVSALGGTDLAGDLDAVGRFNTTWSPRARVDALELKASDPESAAAALATAGTSLERYVELPVQADLPSLFGTLARHGAKAKIRTGGVTAGAFPQPGELVRFIRAALDANVAFKATAGLHHPICGSYALTYDPNPDRAPMYGFLNLFLAAAFLAQGMSDQDAVAVLTDRSPDAFRFADATAEWRGHTINTAELARARRDVATSFGSCSFREPVADLQALALL